MSSNTFQSMNANFKEIYASKMAQLVPEFLKLIKKIAFSAKDKLGNMYHQPVIVGQEHGVTFASSDDDAFSLAAPVAGSIKDAKVRGNPLVLRSVLGYAAASRAVSGGKEAFESSLKFLVANMMRSISKKLEIEILYGQAGYGIVKAIDGTKTIITIDDAEWASGIWAGAEKMPVSFYDVATSTKHGVDYAVKSVDFEGKKITMASAVDASVAVGDSIFHAGAFGNEFTGIHNILSQTTGTLFDINVADYSLFKGNVYDAAAAELSFPKLNQALALAVAKGLDGKVVCYISPKTWADLMSDQAALRRYDQSFGSVELVNGATAIKFFSQNGEMEIEPSIYVKEGYAYCLAIEYFARIGSTDITFQRPGKGDEFFRDLENSAGYELRAYTDQAIFCSAPGKSVLIKNIKNKS